MADLRKMYTTQLATTIVDEMQKQENRVKYLGFSVDESTLTALLIGVKHVNMDDAICGLEMLEKGEGHKKRRRSKKCFKFPHFGSSLVFELSYSEAEMEHFVRILYNGEVVKFCNNGLEHCRLDKFIERFEAKMVTHDKELICGNEGSIFEENSDYLTVIGLMTIVLLFLMLRTHNKEEKERIRRGNEKYDSEDSRNGKII